MDEFCPCGLWGEMFMRRNIVAHVKQMPDATFEDCVFQSLATLRCVKVEPTLDLPSLRQLAGVSLVAMRHSCCNIALT